MAPSQANVFDSIKSINSKVNYSSENFVGVNSWIFNLYFSGYPDSLFFASEANQFTSRISNEMIYDFYFYGLQKTSRKFKKIPYKTKGGIKSDDENNDLIDALNVLYCLSEEKASEALTSLTDLEKKEILQKIFYGGKNVTNKS